MGSSRLRTVKIHKNTYAEINRLRAELMAHGSSISFVRFVDELVRRYGEELIRQLMEQEGDGQKGVE